MDTAKFIVEIISSTITSIFLMGALVITTMLLFVFFSFTIKKAAFRHHHDSYDSIPAGYYKITTNKKKISEIKKYISVEKEKSKYNLIIEAQHEQ